MFFSSLSLMNQGFFSNFADVYLYEITMTYIIGFVIFVLVTAALVLLTGFFCTSFLHGSMIEFLWTLLPLLVLSSIITPSIWFIFVLENFNPAEVLIKVIGHQWYWTYFYSGLDIQVDSYMSSSEDLLLGGMNLLMCDTPCVVPMNTSLQFFVTSSDVLHSWAIPGLCIKNDAIPGVSSLINTEFLLPGIFSGMCSELCGAYHAFMPINLEATSFSLFMHWIENLNL